MLNIKEIQNITRSNQNLEYTLIKIETLILENASSGLDSLKIFGARITDHTISELVNSGYTVRKIPYSNLSSHPYTFSISW